MFSFQHLSQNLILQTRGSQPGVGMPLWCQKLLPKGHMFLENVTSLQKETPREGKKKESDIVLNGSDVQQITRSHGVCVIITVVGEKKGTQVIKNISE